MPRLLILAPNDRYFWTHRRHLARAALRAGYEVLVAVPEGPYVGRLREEGFELRTVAKQRVRTLRGALGAFLDILALYRRERPDLVHHVSMRAILAGGLAARLARVPGRVALVSGLGSLFVSGRAWQRLCITVAYRLVLGASKTLVVFQNQDDRAWFLRRHLVRPELARLIPGSGVELEKFASIRPPCRAPSAQPIILCAGRLIADKGVRTLIEAASILRERGVSHRLLLVGAVDGGNPSSLSVAELRRHAEAGALEWRPWTNAVAEVYALSDLACLPSYREGLPLFLLEAAAAGLPVVAGDSPGTRDTIVPGKTGLLAPPGDPRALADVLQELLGDSELRRRFGAAGRLRVQKCYSAQRIDAATLTVYQEAFPGPGEAHSSPS